MEALPTPEDVAPQDTKKRQDKKKNAKFWAEELTNANKRLEKWHKQGNRIVERFLDSRSAGTSIGIERMGARFRLNLFHANIKSLQDMMFANIPQVEASRQHQDSADDVARVAANIAERLINIDLADHGQEYDSILRSVLQDRLLPGLGVARVRYEAEFETVTVGAVAAVDGTVIEAGQEVEQLKFEDAPVDYYHWQDVLWGWTRSWAKLPWVAFKSYLSKEEVEKRFGKDVKDQLEFKKQKVNESDDFGGDQDLDSPHMKAEIWEIWDKEKREVVWYSKGASKLLDRRPDPLKLSGFFPCPPFLLANPTTTLYTPTPDYHLAQDLYNEVDRLQTRISIITEAVKVVGVYDAKSEGVERMFKEGIENDLIPVDNWAMFAEGGGLQGSIDWFPVREVVETLNTLIQVRDQTIQLLYQVTGMSDIMRGSVNPYEGVGQSQIKSQYGSIPVQSLQDQFARFAGDLMQLKLEVICRHFDPQTIATLSNMQFSPDVELIQPAIMLLKQPEMAHVRLKVRPEVVAMEDFARLKVERTEFLNALATYMQSAAPMLEAEPDAMPYLLKMLQWTLSGFKGSSEIEGVMDKAIEGAIQKAQQAAANPQPTEEDKQAQAEQAKLQGELQKIQAKAQADAQTRNQDLQADLQTAQAAHVAKMQEIAATHQSRMTEIIAKAEADSRRTQEDLDANIQQTIATATAESEKDTIEHEMDVEKKVLEHELSLDEMTEQSLQEIDKMTVQSTAMYPCL
jgi:hypothetical protein